MANSNSLSWRSRPLGRVMAFLLFGFLAGVAWFAALMPVVVTGTVGYDLSRCAFAVCVLVAVVSLFYRPWREYGLGVFFLGLLLGITCWAVLLPVRLQPGGWLINVVFLFGFPLAITVMLSVGFLLACRRSDRKTRLTGGTSSPAAAPRRFGTGTLLIVVLAVSLLFATARQLDMPPTLSLLAGAFLGIIGGLQMLMNNVPRAASIGTGAVLLPLTLAATWTTIGASSNPLLAAVVSTPADIVFVGAHLAAVGAVFGYVGGVLVAGLFLIIDLAGRPLRPSRVVDPPG